MIGYTFNDGGRADAGYRGKTGDCMVRAIAILTKRPYKNVYTQMAELNAAYGLPKTGNASLANRHVPKGKGRGRKFSTEVCFMAFGLSKVKQTVGERLTYTEAYARYGDCIVRTRKHVCAIKDGKVQDIFDGRVYEWPALVEFDGEVGTVGEAETRERKALSIFVRGAYKPMLDDSDIPVYAIL